jgi:hypothetical protein
MFIDFHFIQQEANSGKTKCESEMESQQWKKASWLMLQFCHSTSRVLRIVKKNRKKEIFSFFHYKINEQQFFVALALREKLTMNNK